MVGEALLSELVGFAYQVEGCQTDRRALGVVLETN